MLTPHEIVERARTATGHPTRPTHAGLPEGRRRPPRVPFALLVTGLIVGSLALLLALNTASAANELRRHGLVEKNNAVAARVQDLRVKVAASAAPANLAKAAAELGMVPAGNPAFVVIGPDGKAVVMGKPKAATAAPVKVDKPAKPKPTATPSPTGTVTGTATGTAPVARPSSTPARTTPGGTPGRTTPAPARPTTPTTTPTPVVTLPGGTR